MGMVNGELHRLSMLKVDLGAAEYVADLGCCFAQFVGHTAGAAQYVVDLSCNWRGQFLFRESWRLR